jgi:hypothetical protein
MPSHGVGDAARCAVGCGCDTGGGEAARVSGPAGGAGDRGCDLLGVDWSCDCIGGDIDCVCASIGGDIACDCPSIGGDIGCAGASIGGRILLWKRTLTDPASPASTAVGGDTAVGRRCGFSGGDIAESAGTPADGDVVVGTIGTGGGGGSRGVPSPGGVGETSPAASGGPDNDPTASRAPSPGGSSAGLAILLSG